MKIGINTDSKIITIYGRIKISELLETLKSFKIDSNEWSIEAESTASTFIPLFPNNSNKYNDWVGPGITNPYPQGPMYISNQMRNVVQTQFDLFKDDYKKDLTNSANSAKP